MVFTMVQLCFILGCSFDISRHLSYPYMLMVNKCRKDTTADRIYKENVAVLLLLLLLLLFIHPFCHTSNIGHVNHNLQFVHYNITYNIWTSAHNSIKGNIKFIM